MRSIVALFAFLTFFFGIGVAQISPDLLQRENAYRINNLGVALLEQFKHDDAVERFRQALSLKPDFALARLNLAIALFNAQKLRESREAVNLVLRDTPDLPQANYVLGLINRTENNPDEGLAAFRKVLEVDPLDVGANINIGQILSQQRKYDEAIEHFQTAYRAESYNTTVIYNLATAHQRAGRRERASELLVEFQSLRESSAGTSLGLNYLEQGRYAEAIASTGAESELVDPADPQVSFVETEIGLRFSRPRESFSQVGAVLFDFDNDDDLDIALTNPARILRNSGGKFMNVTAGSGDYGRVQSAPGSRIIAGDFDRDSLPDLFVVRSRGYSLYRNLGKGRFADVTQSARIPAKTDLLPPMTCAFVDADHDGDLDIVIGGTGRTGNRLFRNNGNSTFSDYSSEAKIDTGISAISVVPTDY
ncbi:MAG: tetratricopeptide repeat protein, partial [Acidobacteria bacterium]|nr:tetratricopeptide repeat protein [Acidobacteriota bacterium]